MSCLQRAIVFTLPLGAIEAYPIKFKTIDLSAESISLSGKIRFDELEFVRDLTFQVLNQDINLGVTLVQFNTTDWPETLLGRLIPFDVVLTITSSVDPIFSTEHVSPIMYVELTKSATLSPVLF